MFVFGCKNASQPTPSVAVAFKSRQDLKLEFSSNPKEDWILWSNYQPRVVSSSCSSFVTPKGKQKSWSCIEMFSSTLTAVADVLICYFVMLMTII